jgi:hypothetical protein
MISKIIRTFIVICVGVSLLPLYTGNGLIGFSLKENKKETKQTYEEYVRERLNVERMMKW